MRARKITEGVYWVGVIDPDRKLFEEITPLPDGTSYNSYLVRGKEKTALIDTVEPEFCDVLLDRLENLNVDHIDYVVSNHAEQDHSGSLPMVLERYPEARILATPRAKKMLLELLPLPEDDLGVVEDGETVDLGGRTLEFIHAPWVHWPETMFTYLREDRILFSCDLFGSHMATNDLFVKDEGRVLDTARRYYAEVMMPYSGPVRRNMEKIKDLPIISIAPSHGPVYDRPELILEAYRSWVDEVPRNLVVLPYVSMHGSTKKMVTYLTESLIEKGVRVQCFNLADTDVGRLSMAMVEAATVVFGSPNILNGMHPKVVYVAYLMNALRVKARYATIIGSFGWAEKMDEQLKALLGNLRVELLKPVLTLGLPGKEDYSALDELAAAIARNHAAVTSDWGKTQSEEVTAEGHPK
ncbi:MAG: MBL fold hydrolase [Candidatus Glassbacteria bacterium RIFCSPLOWO2_12_FULL_58_11]|uniref:MBL fold hydrolase n=1 Tax=Candidatus Glassbacteria bacterium RIFCSPLOWO2_12_FULL_58_11 TaxID=1817867 RepID=A0A1F5YTM6_9BACT|nr:MAG: MBL fold hydrolase [Candidatus Glassbacteria bacterium RIFCSPLOWO2_12_FULL_58_11]